MGDMADWIVGNIVDLSTLSGPQGRRASPKTCRCCGKKGLRWGQYNGKWRLFEGGELHACPVNPLRSEGGEGGVNG